LPVLFAHTANQLVLSSIPQGLLGGMANAATLALVMRCCPKGLEGTLMMLAWSLYSVATAIGNVFGTQIYEAYGFTTCIVITTVVYALMLPLAALVPKDLIATPDGTPSALVEEPPHR
jgi:MFS family permease